jgi:branched-chain amino acid transport system permease protein
MATIAFAEIVRLVSLNWVSLTRGPAGLSRIPYPKIGSFAFSDEHRFYYLTLLCVGLAYFAIARMINSRIGRALRAIRNDETAAWVSGVNIVRYKILALVVASFFAGIAGSLYAHLNSFISPHIFTLEETVKVLTMVVVGGAGSVAGSVIGAIVLMMVSEYLRALMQLRLVVYAAMMLAVLMFAPKGLYGIFRQLADRLKARSERAMAKPA